MSTFSVRSMQRYAGLASLLLTVMLLPGCRSHGSTRTQYASMVVTPTIISAPAGETHFVSKRYHASSRLPAEPFNGIAEVGLASASDPTAFEEVEWLADEAQRLDTAKNAACVDLYYQAARRAAPLAAKSCRTNDEADDPANKLYAETLTDLIDSAQRYQRLRPTDGLWIREQGEMTRIPLRYYGFSWTAQDFTDLSPAAEHESSELARRYSVDGLGVPLVARRPRTEEPEPLYANGQTFPVTAILRASDEEAGAGAVEFYNPHVYDAVEWGGKRVPMACDLSAPIAAMLKSTPRQYLEGFTAPADISVRPKVIFTEPYQPGKIPVLLIHGLYSDPVTWAEMLNELKAERDIYQRYQFWLYRYPTGGGLLESVTRLRIQLRTLHEQLDPTHTDESLNHMVLVGHSLGGLVSKMQVTYSQNILWKHVARGSFTRLRATPEIKTKLAQGFFFEPSPFITRVVFIGTPHRGSAAASRLSGRLSKKLVQVGAEANWEYETLIEDNPTLLSPELERSLPTSVDVLEPSSKILQGIERLPVDPQVRLHSIMGTKGLPFQEPGDGVVSIHSARHANVESEKFVPERHAKLHRHPDTMDEMLRILRLHAAESQCSVD